MFTMKRITAGFAAVILCLTIALMCPIPVSSATSFDEGDYRYTLVSDSTVMISKYYGDSTELVLPDFVGTRMVVGIYQRCFEQSDVVSVVMPRNYASIGAFAFNGCKSLTTVMLSSGLTSIGKMAFYGCESLRDIDFTIPEKLNTIGFGAFINCKSLMNAELPDTLSVMENNAFSGCASLSEVKLPQSMTVIPEYAFYGCGFTSLDLPEGIAAVREGAFASNASLESLTLPYSLTAIGSGCFKDDPLLKEVFVSDKVTSIDATSFSPMADNGTLKLTCYKDSCTAELYSVYGISGLNAIDKILGDVNLDGVLDITDATAIQKYLAELQPLSLTQLAVADANSDGEIDISDATKVQYRVAGY